MLFVGDVIEGGSLAGNESAPAESNSSRVGSSPEKCRGVAVWMVEPVVSFDLLDELRFFGCFRPSPDFSFMTFSKSSYQKPSRLRCPVRSRHSSPAWVKYDGRQELWRSALYFCLTLT